MALSKSMDGTLPTGHGTQMDTEGGSTLPAVRKGSYRLKGDKLVFLNQVTGDTLVSNSATPRQHCVCTICSCGRHHCPHRWRANRHPIGASEYRDSYISPTAGFRRDPIRHDHLSTFADHLPPDHFLTTHAVSFVPHAVKPIDKHGHPISGAGKMRPFEGTTTHREDYDGKQPESRMKSCKRLETMPSRIPFQGETIHRSDMLNWFKDGKNFCASRTDGMHQPLHTQPFDATTTHRADFVQPPKYSVAATPFRPEFISPSFAPFPHKSEYDLQYTEKEINLCPVPGLPSKEPSQLTGHVHYLQTGARASDPASYRPATVRMARQLRGLDLTSLSATGGVGTLSPLKSVGIQSLGQTWATTASPKVIGK